MTMTTMTSSLFKVGDRVFTHYEMKWGTITKVLYTEGDTTWYKVKYDDGSSNMMDDAHGNWDMARVVPPHIAKRFGYGDDPNQ